MTRCSPPADVEAPEAALRTLLGSKSSLYDDGPKGPASYDFRSLSLPEKGGQCSLDEWLSGEDLEDLRNLEARLFLTDAALKEKRGIEGKAHVYWDPKLKYDNRAYTHFIRVLYERNMIDFTLDPAEYCCVFCVKKKNGRLRLIVDARKFNQMLKRPPSTKLASCASFAETYHLSFI